MHKFGTIFIGLLMTCLLAVTVRAAEVTYYHTDAMGTPLAITDDKGKVVWKGDYLPFGEERTIVNNPDKNKRRFVGKEKDEESGLHYFGARYMDEKSGRFISPDPVTPVDPKTSKTNTALLANPLRLNRYVYGLNNPYRYVDPDGNVAETVWDIANVAMGAASLAGNISAGNVGGAIVDAVGLVVDVAATAVPVVPGGAGAAIKGARAAGKGAPSFDAARRTAFERAGMTDPSKVQFSKIDPKTGTVVEFKGQGGAKVGYDGPHQSPGPYHDTSHISWQSAGKRGSGGAQRGNEPYSGPQHPSRLDRKNQ